MPSFEVSNKPPYYWKNNNTTHYYEATKDGFVLVKLPTRKNRVNHLLQNKKTRKKQRGGLKKQLGKRQYGQRNLFHKKPVIGFEEFVNVDIYEKNNNKQMRPIPNTMKTKTRGVYEGTPHKSDAEYQQLVSHLYGKIQEESNTPEQMWLTIQNIIAQSNNTNTTRKLKKQLEHKLTRNYYGK